VSSGFKTPIKDKITLERFYAQKYASSCEDCTHFDASTETCTFGFPTEPFRRATQISDLHALGEMAFCRAIEID